MCCSTTPKLLKFNGRNLDIIGEIYFWHYTEYYLQTGASLGSYTSILSFLIFELVEQKEILSKKS